MVELKKVQVVEESQKKQGLQSMFSWWSIRSYLFLTTML